MWWFRGKRIFGLSFKFFPLSTPHLFLFYQNWAGRSRCWESVSIPLAVDQWHKAQSYRYIGRSDSENHLFIELFVVMRMEPWGKTTDRTSVFKENAITQPEFEKNTIGWSWKVEIMLISSRVFKFELWLAGLLVLDALWCSGVWTHMIPE